MAHHRERDNVRAGYVYLVMASFGTLALLLAFGLLAGPDGGYAFAAMRAADPTPIVAALVLILALVGAGSKAGLVPLHVWLPLAHPAAPSHVSALMSGVMTKVAVYGFVRIVFDLLGPPAMVVEHGGAGARRHHRRHGRALRADAARSQAAARLHTVENIGIIFIGLGLALAFKANGMALAAALALTAALLHVFNHSLFKSLLFFGAGAVLDATGERDMEHLGGLIHRMPQTAFVFLVGCVAISALPPLNGFVSEWLTFQAILLSPQLPSWGLKFLVPAVGALLALSAALAAACFVKAFGVTFLGRPRTRGGRARARDRPLLARRDVLSSRRSASSPASCPGSSSMRWRRSPRRWSASACRCRAGVQWLSIVPIAESRSSYNGLLVFLFIVISGVARGLRDPSARLRQAAPRPGLGLRLSRSRARRRNTPPTSFAQPIRRVFGTMVFRAREHVEMPPPGDMRPARFAVELRDLIWDALYAPVAARSSTSPPSGSTTCSS